MSKHLQIFSLLDFYAARLRRANVKELVTRDEEGRLQSFDDEPAVIKFVKETKYDDDRYLVVQWY